MTPAEKILQKALVASNLDSRQWNSIQAGIRDRAFFSAKVESVEFLSEARRMIAEQVSGGKSLSEIRRDLREVLLKQGYQPKPGEEGTIKDLLSKRRLDVLVKTNVDQARGFIRYCEDNTPGGFAAFPAQELVRVEQRKQPRRWDVRWQGAGGRLYHGRMIALKDDPVWTGISAFGNPFPPFDFGSGMGVRNISRKEALELGVLTENDIERGVRHREAMIKDGTHPSLNGHLEASIPMTEYSNEYKELYGHFGDQIQIVGHKAVWQDTLIRDVLDGKRTRAKLGKATKELLDEIAKVAPQETVSRIAAMDPSFSRSLFTNHIEPKHVGANETHLNGVPLKDSDFELLPSVWRRPDRVQLSGNNLLLDMDTFDGHIMRLVVSPFDGMQSCYKIK